MGPTTEKRQHKPAAVMKSPFLNQFGSSHTKAAGKRPAKDSVQVKQVLPFDQQLGFNLNVEDTEAFSVWYHDGYRPKNKYYSVLFLFFLRVYYYDFICHCSYFLILCLQCRYKFLGRVRLIDFDLGVLNVTDKLWFYRLVTCGEFLTDEVSNLVL